MLTKGVLDTAGNHRVTKSYIVCVSTCLYYKKNFYISILKTSF